MHFAYAPPRTLVSTVENYDNSLLTLLCRHVLWSHLRHGLGGP